MLNETFINLGNICYGITGVLILTSVLMYGIGAVIGAIKDFRKEYEPADVALLVSEVNESIEILESAALHISDLKEPEITRYYDFINMSIDNLQTFNRFVCGSSIPTETMTYSKYGMNVESNEVNCDEKNEHKQ